MGLARRSSDDADLRAAGFDAAVGLLSGRTRRARADGRTCSHCGAEARVDMIDMPRTRAYLTCLECGHEWDTDRMQVTRRSAR